MQYFDNTLNVIDNNKIVYSILSLFVILYGSLAGPELPSLIRNLFNNVVFRLLILGYIMYRGNKAPQFSIMLAVAFTITMNLITTFEIKEEFKRDN